MACTGKHSAIFFLLGALCNSLVSSCMPKRASPAWCASFPYSGCSAKLDATCPNTRRTRSRGCVMLFKRSRITRGGESCQSGFGHASALTSRTRDHLLCTKRMGRGVHCQTTVLAC